MNKLHYNTEITLNCSDLTLSNNTKTITVNAESSSGQYTTKYGVVFKDLPKYKPDGTVYEYNLTQEIGATSPGSSVYQYQHVNAYDDITNKTVITDNLDTHKLGSDIADSSNVRVDVTAYGIQSDELGDFSSDFLSETDLNNIWDILERKQMSTNAGT